MFAVVGIVRIFYLVQDKKTEIKYQKKLPLK